MSKFFSLTSKEVKIADGEKVVSKKDFETLKKAFEILKATKEEMEEYKKQVLKECEKIKKEAHEKGFEEGLLKLQKQILFLSKEIKDFAKEMKKKILPISIKAAKKILAEELRLHPDRILDIVIKSLKPVIQHKKIKIYVNREDLEILEKNKNKIKKKLAQVELFSIEERDDIEKGGCIIETEAGIINAQLETVWRTLEIAFKKSLKDKI